MRCAFLPTGASPTWAAPPNGNRAALSCPVRCSFQSVARALRGSYAAVCNQGDPFGDPRRGDLDHRQTLSRLGGLVASLPLVSVLSMMWLYGETRDVESVAKLSLGAFWFFLPSVPMFLVIPALLRAGVGFVATMAIACVMTILLYAGMNWLAPRVGIVL